MELRFKELDDLVREVSSLREELASLKAKINPSQEWYDLKLWKQQTVGNELIIYY